jgi:hypothetical protein
MTDLDRTTLHAIDAGLARDLGLDRPWASGPRFGTCPGRAPYGRGLSLTVVHWGGCCARWAQARRRRLEALDA